MDSHSYLIHWRFDAPKQPWSTFCWQCRTFFNTLTRDKNELSSHSTFFQLCKLLLCSGVFLQTRWTRLTVLFPTRLQPMPFWNEKGKGSCWWQPKDSGTYCTLETRCFWNALAWKMWVWRVGSNINMRHARNLAGHLKAIYPRISCSWVHGRLKCFDSISLCEPIPLPAHHCQICSISYQLLCGWFGFDSRAHVLAEGECCGIAGIWPVLLVVWTTELWIAVDGTVPPMYAWFTMLINIMEDYLLLYHLLHSCRAGQTFSILRSGAQRYCMRLWSRWKSRWSCPTGWTAEMAGELWVFSS